jgi:hypothetical protein
MLSDQRLSLCCFLIHFASIKELEGLRETRERVIALLEAAGHEEDEDGGEEECNSLNGSSTSRRMMMRRKSQAKATTSAVDEELAQAEGMRRQLRVEAGLLVQRIRQKREESVALLASTLRTTEDEMTRMVRNRLGTGERDNAGLWAAARPGVLVTKCAQNVSEVQV